MSSRVPSHLWFLPLAPLMLWQGRSVQRRAQRLPPAVGREGSCGAGGRPNRLVGLGDSIIAGIGVAHHTQSLVGRTAARLHDASGNTIAWRAHGFSGLRVRDVTARLLPDAPVADIYLISAGVNDAIAGTSARAFAVELRALAHGLRAHSPQCSVVFAGIPPISSFPALPWPLSAYLGQRGQALQAAARSVGIASTYLACYEFPAQLDAAGFASDGFHPGPAGCDVWAREIVALLVRGDSASRRD